MANQNKCRVCNHSEFAEGVALTANLKPLNKPLSVGSRMIVTLCGNCGEVSSLKVVYPKRF